MWGLVLQIRADLMLARSNISEWAWAVEMCEVQTENQCSLQCTMAISSCHAVQSVKFDLNCRKGNAVSKERWYHWKVCIGGSQNLFIYLGNTSSSLTFHWIQDLFQRVSQWGFLFYDQEQIYDDFIVIIIEWSQKHLTFLKEELKFTFFFSWF